MIERRHVLITLDCQQGKECPLRQHGERRVGIISGPFIDIAFSFSMLTNHFGGNHPLLLPIIDPHASPCIVQVH